MTVGLNIWDADGNIIMDKDTFTVRMVDARILYLGHMTPGHSISVPLSSEVHSGMFAMVIPLTQYPVGMNFQGDQAYIDTLPRSRTYATEYDQQVEVWQAIGPSAIDNYGVCLPSATVYAGGVVLHASPVPDSRTVADVAVYVFTYI